MVYPAVAGRRPRSRRSASSASNLEGLLSRWPSTPSRGVPRSSHDSAAAKDVAQNASPPCARSTASTTPPFRPSLRPDHRRAAPPSSWRGWRLGAEADSGGGGLVARARSRFGTRNARALQLTDLRAWIEVPHYLGEPARSRKLLDIPGARTVDWLPPPYTRPDAGGMSTARVAPHATSGWKFGASTMAAPPWRRRRRSTSAEHEPAASVPAGALVALAAVLTLVVWALPATGRRHRRGQGHDRLRTPAPALLSLRAKGRLLVVSSRRIENIHESVERLLGPLARSIIISPTGYFIVAHADELRRPRPRGQLSFGRCRRRALGFRGFGKAPTRVSPISKDQALRVVAGTDFLTRRSPTASRHGAPASPAHPAVGRTVLAFMSTGVEFNVYENIDRKEPGARRHALRRRTCRLCVSRRLAAGRVSRTASPSFRIHGNECAGMRVTDWLLRAGAPVDTEVWVVQNLNPDGLARGTRQNGRGVDLNRNFGALWKPIGRRWDPQHSGPRPWSEPETRLARALILRLRPTATVWFHAAADARPRLGPEPRRRTPLRAARRHALPLAALAERHGAELAEPPLPECAVVRRTALPRRPSGPRRGRRPRCTSCSSTGRCSSSSTSSTGRRPELTRWASCVDRRADFEAAGVRIFAVSRDSPYFGTSPGARCWS